jgi:hypothetical protein
MPHIDTMNMQKAAHADMQMSRHTDGNTAVDAHPLSVLSSAMCLCGTKWAVCEHRDVSRLL